MNAKDIEKGEAFTAVTASVERLHKTLNKAISDCEESYYLSRQDGFLLNQRIGHSSDDTLSERCVDFSFDHCRIPYDLLVAITKLVGHSEKVLKDRFENADSSKDLNYQIDLRHTV